MTDNIQCICSILHNIQCNLPMPYSIQFIFSIPQDKQCNFSMPQNIQCIFSMPQNIKYNFYLPHYILYYSRFGITNPLFFPNRWQRRIYLWWVTLHVYLNNFSVRNKIPIHFDTIVLGVLDQVYTYTILNLVGTQ